MSITHPGAASGPTKITNNATPDISAPRQPKKSFLSILCCGVPDNTADPNDPEVLANRVSKPLVGRPTTASRPDDVVTGQQNDGVPKPQAEKDALNQTEPSHDRHDTSNADPSRPLQSRGPANGELGRSVSLRDQPLPALPQEAGSSSSQVSPTAVVQVPVRTSPVRMPTGPDPGANRESVDEDARAENTDPLPNEKDASTGAISRREEVAKPLLPLPPSAPQVAPTDEAVPETSEGKQQWLLPPIAPRFKGKKCLVLDLDETLVHSSFKILHQADFTIPVEIEGQYHNVYVIKRPGVDQFMKRVGELYEVVVFTASVSKYGDPLLDQLDIHHVVHHRLFRESCYNHQGNYVKDLSQVGRDLRETIIIDNSPTSYIFHPQHAVPISSWFSDAHDNELLDLIPVLEDLAGSQVRDVSLVLDVAL